MSQIVTRPERRGRRALAALGILLAIPAVIAGVIWLVVAGGGIVPSPATVEGHPLRAGERVYLLTSQWRTFRPVRGRGESYTNLLIDVWAFDAADARPVWRTRLEDTRRGVNQGRDILGAQGDVLWVVEAKGLTGLSLKDGARVADSAAIEAANPALKGLMPTARDYYVFDAAGLAFTAADGRQWRLGDGLKVVPAPEKPTPRPDTTVPPRIAGGVGTGMFMGRDLQIAKTRWLGLAADSERAGLLGAYVIGLGYNMLPIGEPLPLRQRLWGGRVKTPATYDDERPVLKQAAPLPESPEFLEPGLLGDGRDHGLPILLSDPDSVLVLHSDRLGDDGKLQVSRVAGPAGKVLWTAKLPLKRLEAVMPGERSLVLLGTRDEQHSLRDRLPISIHQLVAIDLATGKVGVYGLRVKATKPADIPPSSTKLEP